LGSNDIVRIGNSTLPWKSYFSGGTAAGDSTVAGDRGSAGAGAGAGGGYQAPIPTPPTSMPTTYLWQSVVVTILCCWPFGIPAIVNASKVQKLWSAGDYAGAQGASKKASNWSLTSLLLGIVLFIITIIYYVVVAAAM
jgi:hypothetical protein